MPIVVTRRPYPPSVLSRIPMEKPAKAPAAPAPEKPKPAAKKVAAKKTKPKRKAKS